MKRLMSLLLMLIMLFSTAYAQDMQSVLQEIVMTRDDSVGTGKVSDELLAKAVKKVFDLRPGVLIEQLHLRDVKYAPLAAYGHFGRNELDLPWEKTDRIELLLHAVELLCGYRPNTHGVRRSRLERYGKGVFQ